jgi:xylulokinase
VPGKYFIADEQETAGACLAFLRDNILYADDLLAREQRVPNVYPLFDQIVEMTAPGSGKLIFTPWLHGERTPVDDRHARGGFHNLSLGHTRAMMIRAVFEGVAYNSRWLLRYVERFVGRRLDNIRMVGGGAKSDVWCQIHADVLGRTVRQVQDPVQVNVRGIALLAAVACGLITFDQIGDVAIANTYRPNPANRALYDELFAAYEAIYKQNRRLYAALNRETP